MSLQKNSKRILSEEKVKIAGERRGRKMRMEATLVSATDCVLLSVAGSCWNRDRADVLDSVKCYSLRKTLISLMIVDSV